MDATTFLPTLYTARVVATKIWLPTLIFMWKHFLEFSIFTRQNKNIEKLKKKKEKKKPNKIEHFTF